MLYPRGMRGRFQLSSFLSAAVLSATTLSVFASLQNYGPESVLRRFHQALVPNSKGQSDFDAIAYTFTERADSSAVKALVMTVRELLRNGPPRLVGMDRELVQGRQPSPQVREAMVYRNADGSPVPIVWVMEKQNAQWRISATKTLTIQHEVFGWR